MGSDQCIRSIKLHVASTQVSLIAPEGRLMIVPHTASTKSDDDAIVQVVTCEQMGKGFRNLLAAAADLKLDVPCAPEQIATFIARAVVDGALPPAFVEDAPLKGTIQTSAGCPQMLKACHQS